MLESHCTKILEKTDLEENTIDDVLAILRREYEDDDQPQDAQEPEREDEAQS